MKLSEVLKERDAQLEMKKVVEQMRKEQDDEIKKHIEKLQMEKEIAEKEKFAQKQMELDRVTEFNKKRIQANAEKLKLQKDEVVKEGELLEKLNAQLDIERDQLEQIRLKKIRDLKETYDKTAEFKRKTQLAQEILEEEENEEIRTYAAAKRKMATLKREKEVQLRK